MALASSRLRYALRVAVFRAFILVLFQADASLAQTGGFSGTVTDALNGVGLQAVLISVHTATGTVRTVATTTSTGTYTVSGLAPGIYYAHTAVPSSYHYIDQAYDSVPCVPCDVTQSAPIVVNSGAVTTSIDFALLAGGSITGVVSGAGTGSPLSALVSLYSATGNLVKTESTDAGGAYTFRGLVAGSYFARAITVPNANYVAEAHNNVTCAPCDVTTSVPINVSGVAETSGIDFVLSPGGSIAGTVTDAMTGAPIGAAVSVYSFDGRIVASALPGAGAYSVGGLPPGTYFARTSMLSNGPNYVDEAYGGLPCVPCDVTATTPIVVSGTSTTPGITFALSPGGSISGMVRDARTGTALGSVQVSVYDSSGRLVTSTTTSITFGTVGAYSVRGLPAGTYFARTGYSGAYEPQLFNGASCPYLACSVTSGVPIVVSAGGSITAIDFNVPTLGPTDLAVDFGAPNGLWLRSWNGDWRPLHPLNPVRIVAGDLDGNAIDDLVVNFGPGLGVYAWMNDATWMFMHPASPSDMVTGDLDHNGHDDVVFVFPGFGVWRWADGGWGLLHGLDAGRLAVGQMDGASGEDLLVDFPVYGVYVFANNATWTALHPLNTTTLLAADLDGNGRDEAILGFAGYGLWAYGSNGTWTQLHSLNPRRVAAGHVDLDSSADLAIDFGSPYGVWLYRNGATWTQLHGLSPRTLLLVDRDASGRDEVVLDFGPGVGLWEYANDRRWNPVHPQVVEGLAGLR